MPDEPDRATRAPSAEAAALAPAAPPATPTNPTSGAAPSEGFDQVLGDLRGLVERLESGRLTLEEALVAFEHGVGLARRGAQILDGAERRVEVLLRREDGGEGVAPFQPPPPTR
jgi:exodeoxyribonuclease VII small subunit